jgi:hypothetical protein
MRYFVCFFLFFLALSSPSQPKLLTTAERSDFTSTSTYSDVMSFISELEKSSRFIRTETIATSVEGRQIPLIIIGNPLPASPSDLKNDRRTIVYLQGNIHAGEVEGKEALLMYARDLLASGKIPRNTIILICPIINPDGNEKFSTSNRTSQNGPPSVGVRYNGQFLDLNRDGMKAESPEIKGLLTNVFTRWDPDVFMDCHTTNGSYHVEPVTFTWMVNPNGDTTLIKYMRDIMMPAVSSTLMNKYNVENCFYGEFIDMMQPEKGWILDASGPRYISNYYGIRNRLGILNENYVYADFKSRVWGCYYLTRSVADYVSEHGQVIRDLVSAADERTVERGLNPGGRDSFAIEYTVRPAPGKVLVKTYEAELVSKSGPWPSYRKTDRRKDVTVPYYIDYYPLKSVRFPFAYLLTVPDPDIINNLKTHGIRIERLSADSEFDVESFVVAGLKPVQRPNQGHYTNTVSGSFKKVRMNFPAGTYVVRTSQPLANVAAYLLEPQSDDGLVFWNFFDKYLVPQWGSGFNPYPVYRVVEQTEIRTSQKE